MFLNAHTSYPHFKHIGIIHPILQGDYHEGDSVAFIWCAVAIASLTLRALGSRPLDKEESLYHCVILCWEFQSGCVFTDQTTIGDTKQFLSMYY